MIQTVDNYYLSNIEVITIQKDRDEFLESNSYYCLSNKTINNKNYKKEDRNKCC